MNQTKNNLRLYARAWFGLTVAERLAAAIVLGLFLLGLSARYWILRQEHSETITAPGRTSEREADGKLKFSISN